MADSPVRYLFRAWDKIARLCSPAYWMRRAHCQPPPRPVSSPEALCREIRSSDLPDVVDLLSAGFGHERDRTFWVHAAEALSRYDSPAGYPKYGYLLEDRGAVVGVILLIFSERHINGTRFVRCNGSSAYVAPGYRGFGAMMIKRALRFKEVTYLNLTAGENTYAMVRAQGYRTFVSGRFVALPLLGRRGDRLSIRPADDATSVMRLPAEEAKILRDHENFGCISLVGETANEAYPFVFLAGRRCGIPLVHLIYCRDQTDFVRFHHDIGEYLARRGFLLVVLDSNGPVDGLVGRYFELHAKFVMGPENVRLGDLAYTEGPLFGV